VLASRPKSEVDAESLYPYRGYPMDLENGEERSLLEGGGMQTIIQITARSGENEELYVKTTTFNRYKRLVECVIDTP
jgi:hypothetical protein